MSSECTWLLFLYVIVISSASNLVSIEMQSSVFLLFDRQVQIQRISIRWDFLNAPLGFCLLLSDSTVNCIANCMWTPPSQLLSALSVLGVFKDKPMSSNKMKITPTVVCFQLHSLSLESHTCKVIFRCPYAFVPVVYINISNRIQE